MKKVWLVLLLVLSSALLFFACRKNDRLNESEVPVKQSLEKAFLESHRSAEGQNRNGMKSDDT